MTTWSTSVALLFLVAAPCFASSAGPVYNPANGHYYQVVPGNVTWDQAKLGAEALTYLGVQGHLVTLSDLAEDQFVYFTLTGSSLGNSWIGLYQDMLAPDYSEPAGGWYWVTGEPLTYSNWKAGEPNNSGGAEHYGGYWPADEWNDYQLADGAVGRYVVEFDTLAASPYCFGDGSAAACPCGNAGGPEVGCTNSTGVGAQVTTLGTASLVSSDLRFVASGLLPGQLAILFEGSSVLALGNGVLFGDGLRCAGGQLRRMGYRVVSAGGNASWLPGSGAWTPGDIRQFQVWYSDPQGSPCGSSFNTSNALEINFLP